MAGRDTPLRRLTPPCRAPLPRACQGVLCDNLLGANWCAERLGRLALLGNSFATYATRWAAPPGVRPATARPGRLLQLVHEGAAARRWAGAAHTRWLWSCACGLLASTARVHGTPVLTTAAAAAACSGAVLELPVRDGGYHVASAFNDMSLHIFRPGAASFGDADAAADA